MLSEHAARLPCRLNRLYLTETGYVVPQKLARRERLKTFGHLAKHGPNLQIINKIKIDAKQSDQMPRRETKAWCDAISGQKRIDRRSAWLTSRS